MMRNRKIIFFFLLVLIVLFNFVGVPILLNDVCLQNVSVVEESLRAWEPYHDWPRAW